ncbi:MAG TPA: TonB-dependent receptor [Vicinamibacterales bacterium]|nr:TonB-dependent receptor [Vicinamibacterales bacterium]
MRTSVFVLFLMTAVVAEAGQGALTGTVTDQSGGVVSGAAVIVKGKAGVERQAVTGPQGQFTIDTPADGATLVVRAVGFAESSQPISGPGHVDVVLKAETVRESVTVTSSRTEQRLADVPATVHIVDKATIEQSPAVVADDVLRMVPTFSLFRRTSSLSSHPTSQGVSLRGIGPSGVSRTLVMYDGVPVNDPFGGWVYWTRMPLEAVDRIEVVDSPSSDVYGNYAMGGVINVLGSRPRPRTGEARFQWGNYDSPKGDFFASDAWGHFGASVDGSYFRTDGFPVVIANERGPVDTTASVKYDNTNVKLDYSPNSRVNAFVRGGYFTENRHNGKSTTFGPGGVAVDPSLGTPEANDTTWKSVSGGVRLSLPDDSDLQARVFGDFETFHSNFLAVPNPVTRTTARVSLLQRVPTTGVGTIAQWTKPLSIRHLLSAGFDVRHVDGESQEQAMDPATGLTAVTLRNSGGQQLLGGGYVQGQYWVRNNFSITASGRVDHWRNYDAHNFETTVATGLPTANSRALPERTDTVFSPRLAALYQANTMVSVWGSIGAGFRAPTLNELYRQFRVGQQLTLPNETLGPERLKGGEVGVTVIPVERVSVRSVWYDNRVKNPVSNVTVVGPPALALSTACVGATQCQQRQNLGRTRIWGWQNDVDYRFNAEWRVGVSYLFNQATVREFAAVPTLVGNFLPQVPEHRGSARVSYTNPRVLTATLDVLFAGRQFNEDTNTGTVPGRSEPGLPGYATVEFSASHSFGSNFDAFVGAQNLFDKEYYTGLAPTAIGTPRLINAGVRVRFSGR